MRTSCIALTTALLALAVVAPAQEYRWEQNDKLGIRFKVHKKLEPVPLQIGSADPHTKMQFKPGSEGDYIRGQFSWELFVLEFPKAGGAANAKPAEGGTTAEKHEIESPLKAADFREWVTVKEPGQENRTFQDKGRAEKGKGKTPDYEYWEYSDTDDRFGFWYHCSAVFDFPDRQVALTVRIPAIGKPKPKDNWLKWAKEMITSVEPLKETSTTAAGEPDVKRDEFANTPERQQELDKAKGNIANLDGWDYFTSPNYICLFSWDPSKNDKRKPATTFAHDIVEKLETMRELYQKEYPPHSKMLQLYSILRICYNYADFQKYSGAPTGVVGFFSPSSKELVLFDDKDRYFGNKADTIYSTAMHEGWHQYGHTYFGEKAELHRWYDEGMGDYFGSWSKHGKSWGYEVEKGRYTGIRTQVARGNYIPPREIVTWEIGKFYGSARVVDHYEQAYSMIDFLKRGPEVMGKKFDPSWTTILPKYRDEMLETKDHKKAVEKAFAGVDWAAWEAAWVEWVKSYMKG
jgi:hypothetical protein